MQPGGATGGLRIGIGLINIPSMRFASGVTASNCVRPSKWPRRELINSLTQLVRQTARLEQRKAGILYKMISRQERARQEAFAALRGVAFLTHEIIVFRGKHDAGEMAEWPNAPVC